MSKTITKDEDETTTSQATIWMLSATALYFRPVTLMDR